MSSLFFKNMKTRTVIALSCLIGMIFGVASAFAALKINAWNPELEFTKHSELVKRVIQETKDPDAKASIDIVEYDFGIRDVKEKGKHEFYIKNVGTKPLSLEVNRTTCTCTGIDLSTKRLMPGKTSIATVHYDAERATTGPYNQGGVIVTNDPTKPEIYLSIKGIFTAPIVMEPGSVVFPSVPAAEPRSMKARIFGYEKTPLQFETPQWTDKEHFEIKLTPSELTDKDKEDSMRKNAVSAYDIDITVKPGLPIGTFQEKVQIKANYASEPTFDFLIKGQVSGGAVTVSGMGYNKERGVATIGKTIQGKKLNRSILIQFSGSVAENAKLQVRQIRPEWLKVHLNEPRDIGRDTSRRRLYSLEIEIPADAPLGNFMNANDETNGSVVTLETGLDDSPIIKVPLEFAVER